MMTGSRLKWAGESPGSDECEIKGTLFSSMFVGKLQYILAVAVE